MKRINFYKLGKKTLVLAVLFFATLNVFVANSNKVYLEIFSLDEVEALANNEDEPYNPYCYNGGTGSLQCSIDAGITIFGFGISTACSVTCDSGYYACCGIRCTC